MQTTRPDKTTSTRSRWVLLLTLLLAGVLLYLSLRGLDWAAFWKTIANGHYVFLLIVIPLGSLSYLIRAIRWNIFLGSGKKIPLLSVFWANMVGYMGNAYLPARAGELLRSGYLGNISGLGASFVFATALAERLLDVIALILIGAFCLLWQGSLPPALFSAAEIMGIAGVLGLVFFIVTPFQEKLILDILHKLPLPTNIAVKIEGQISRFLVGMRSLQNMRRLLAFIGLTALIWAVDGFTNTIIARIISQQLNLGQALLLLSALGLSSAIPSTPGYIGVYQFAAVNVLVPFSFTKPEALAFIMISQVLNYLVISFFGMLGLWRMSKIPASPAQDEQPK